MKDLLQTIRQELFSAVVGDVLDAAGMTQQFLPPEIRPLEDRDMLVGRAMPVLEADCAGTEVAYLGEAQPFGLMLAALDDLRPGEVYLCTGASPAYALWGALMTTRAVHLGAAGAVLDGFCRDSKELKQLGFPVFATGRYAQDQAVRGRVIDFRCTVRFRNGVVVRPGDIVMGDIDGVVVIPAEHEEAIVADALKKVRGENLVRKALQNGASATEAFREYGVM
jgi:regulator of RNase E activity RraA